jgi:uncharacterized glyoxalase superfamily protein PhnB
VEGGCPGRGYGSDAAHEYLVRVYRLTPGPLQRNADEQVIHGEVRAGDQVIWLHPASKDYQSPLSLGAVTSMTVIAVDDVDANHARSAQTGAVIVEEPVDQPYGVREYGARDPEGQLWFFQSPLDYEGQCLRLATSHCVVRCLDSRRWAAGRRPSLLRVVVFARHTS